MRFNNILITIEIIGIISLSIFLSGDCFYQSSFPKRYNYQSNGRQANLLKRKLVQSTTHLSPKSINHPSQAHNKRLQSQKDDDDKDINENSQTVTSPTSSRSFISKSVKAIQECYCKFISMVTQPFVNIWNYFFPSPSTPSSETETSKKETCPVSPAKEDIEEIQVFHYPSKMEESQRKMPNFAEEKEKLLTNLNQEKDKENVMGKEEARKFAELRLREIEEFRQRKFKEKYPALNSSDIERAVANNNSLSYIKLLEHYSQTDLANQKVLLPLTFLPSDENSTRNLLDDHQIKTIKYLLTHGAKVFLLPSYGNPVGNEQYEARFSTEQFVDQLERTFYPTPTPIELQSRESSNQTVRTAGDLVTGVSIGAAQKNVVFIPDVEGMSLPAILNNSLQSHSLFMFENILFYSDKQKNMPETFNQKIAKQFNIYVQDDPLCLEDIAMRNFNLHLPAFFNSKCIGYSVQDYLLNKVDAKNSNLFQNSKLELNEDLLTHFPALLGLEIR